MFVCHCRAVTDGTVRATIAQGACSLRELAEGCGAGSRCGGCHLVLQRMLADAAQAASAPPPVLAQAGPGAGYCAA